VDHDEFLGILAGEVEAADTSRGYED
jgi:hypothetical protein